MKKCISMVMLFVSLMLAGTGCSSDEGTPPVLNVNGIEITLGASSPGNLTSQDYEAVFPGNYVPIGNMPAKSWLSSFLSISKDHQTYGYFYLYNPENEEKPYLSSTIYKVTFHMNSEEESYWAENNILVNGVDFFGMDSASVKEKMSEYKLANETDSGSLRYEDGSYEYFFRFDEETGTVSEITVEMTISKSYTEAK